MILQTHHVILKDKIVKKIDHNDVKEFESYINHIKSTFNKFACAKFKNFLKTIP